MDYYLTDGNFYTQKDEWGQTIIFENKKDGLEYVYSDRLFQWNPKKHDELLMKHFGNTSQYWSQNMNKEKIQSFLSDYFESL